jgi:hypothetical protein
MTVSMHENMLERRYQDCDNVPPPKIEPCMKEDSLPEEWKQRLQLLLKHPRAFGPILAFARDQELRRYGLTVERFLRTQVERGRLPANSCPPEYLRYLSDLAD